MAIDTPATIAILGAGPVGIEAGLYARYLGYDVLILEREQVAAHVLAWGHLQMFSPFGELCTPLGLAALRAQDPGYRVAPPDARLTGRQWVDQYLVPLSQSDLLADHIMCGVTVLGVARPHFLKTQSTDTQRSEDGFRVLVEQGDGSQASYTADIVIDATGVFGHPNWCGAGGLPARGERRVGSRIEYGIPDVLGTERAAYEGRRVLVVGSDLSAAATIVALAQLIECVPQTEVTWVTHTPPGAASLGPISLAPYDACPPWKRLAEAGNELALATNPRLNHRAGVRIEAIDFDAADQQFLVTFDADTAPIAYDRLVANVGHRPDRSLYEELQVQECPLTGGPWGVSQSRGTYATPLLPPSSRHAAERLVTTEPNFYILGAKSFGRDTGYLMTAGFAQIRDLFALIGGRASLDLYSTADQRDG